LNIFESKPELIELTRKSVHSLSRRHQIQKMPFYFIVSKVIQSMSKVLKYHELSDEDRKLFKMWIEVLIDEIN